MPDDQKVSINVWQIALGVYLGAMMLGVTSFILYALWKAVEKAYVRG